FPVLDAGTALRQAQDLAAKGRFIDADRELLQAAASDLWSPQPWRELGDLRLQLWRQSQSATDWELFLEAEKGFLVRDSQHFQAYETQGNWRLVAWRTSRQPEDLNAAIVAYRQAAALHPSRAWLHSQLAWALHLAKHDPDAQSEAETALQ